MKVLIFWDIYWRIGRKAFLKHIGELKEKYSPDFVIANVDNITSWKGIIEKHAKLLENAWVDLMTSWDHIFDNFEKIKDYLSKEDSKLIRPLNFYNSSLQGQWYKILEKNWKKLLVVHLLDEIFMWHKVNNPFLELQKIIKKFENTKLDWVIIDFHKEVSSSTYALAFFLEDKASFVFGTHTHIQSNDELILASWIWILNDVWMSWPLYSVIWASYDSVKNRFLTGINKWKIEQELKDKHYVVSAVVVEIENMKCVNIEKIRIRWEL